MANDDPLAGVTEEQALEDVPTGGDTRGETPDAPDQPSQPQQPTPGAPMWTAGQNPMEIPPGIMGGQQGLGQMAGAMGLPQMPPSMAIQQQHGGLLTGLAGALIDGIWGGMAPSAQEARMAPMRMQQMATQMDQQKLAQQQAQEDMQLEPIRAKMRWAQALIDTNHLMHAAQELAVQDRLGISDVNQKLLDTCTAQGSCEVRSQGDLSQVTAYINQQRETNPDEGQYLVPRVEMDAQGNITHAQAVWVNPQGINKNPIRTELTFTDPNTGQVQRTELVAPGNLPFKEQYSILAKGATDYYGQQYGKVGQQLVVGRNPQGQLEIAPRAQAGGLTGATGVGGPMPISPKMQQDWANESSAIDAYTPQLNRYFESFRTNRPNVTDLDLEGMKTLTGIEGEKVSGDLAHMSVKEIEDLILAHPGTGLGEALMKGKTLQDAYAKMSGPGRQMVADYFHTVLANMVYNRTLLKGSPRQQKVVEAEMANIPLPYIDQGSANAYFGDTYKAIQDRRNLIPVNAGMLPGGGVQPAMGAEATAAPTGPTGPQPTQQPTAAQGQPGEMPVVQNGQIIGYTTDRKTMRRVQ